MAFSRPFKEDRLALPLSTPLFSKRSISKSLIFFYCFLIVCFVVVVVVVVVVVLFLLLCEQTKKINIRFSIKACSVHVQ